MSIYYETKIKFQFIYEIYEFDSAYVNLLICGPKYETTTPHLRENGAKNTEADYLLGPIEIGRKFIK